MIETINHYFKHLDSRQKSQFELMGGLYAEWNAKINVISRKDIGNLEVHHILHSLSIAKFITFTPGTHVLDFGCGGGFPGIPLAVMFPGVHFHLLDRVAKKLKVAAAVAESIGLENVSFQHGDIAECKQKFEFVVSRAVMPLPDLLRHCRKNISPQQFNAYPNGLITLKGGNLDSELGSHKHQTILEPIEQLYPGQEYFKDKFITYTTVIPPQS